jgi:hypothetical protein
MKYEEWFLLTNKKKEKFHNAFDFLVNNPHYYRYSHVSEN